MEQRFSDSPESTIRSGIRMWGFPKIGDPNIVP